MLFNISNPIKTQIEASSFNTAVIKFVKKHFKKNKSKLKSITINVDGLDFE
jgi:hypothetical protein